MPTKGKRKTANAVEFRKTPGASYFHEYSQVLAAANSESFGPAIKSTAEIPDNRARSAQLVNLQNAMQLANRSSCRSMFIRSQTRGETVKRQSSDMRVANYGDNWEVLEISDYMKRHQLRLRRMTRSINKNVMHLSDGSIILIDSNQYWRHESVDAEDEYYDSAHAINKDSSRTHFWTRKGYDDYKLSR